MEFVANAHDADAQVEVRFDADRIEHAQTILRANYELERKHAAKMEVEIHPLWGNVPCRTTSLLRSKTTATVALLINVANG